MAIEIVSFPSYNMMDLSVVMLCYVYQEVSILCFYATFLNVYDFAIGLRQLHALLEASIMIHCVQLCSPFTYNMTYLCDFYHKRTENVYNLRILTQLNYTSIRIYM